MPVSNWYIARLLRVLAANFGIAVLALIGFVISTKISDLSRYVVLFVISLLQGGFMVTAFAPITGSEKGLSSGGKIIGWIGFVAWFLVHVTNGAFFSSKDPDDRVLFLEVGAYGIVNFIALLPFYFEPLRRRETARRIQSENAIRQEAESRRTIEAENRERTDSRRRRDARFTCERFYDRYRAQLTDKFPPSRLEEYFKRYLGDNHTADEVERRAEELRATLQDLVEDDQSNGQKHRSIIDLRKSFQQERQRIIDDEQMDNDLKETLLADMAREEELSIREFRQR